MFSLFSQKSGSGVYLDPTAMQSTGHPIQDNIAMDSNFEIADLPVKLELRYVIESKRAASGLDCPKIDYSSHSKKAKVICHLIVALIFIISPHYKKYATHQ